jgi:hypothetical protein
VSRQRIRIANSPWPARQGCEGWIVTDELDPDIYPRHGLHPREEIILLDDDPLARPHDDRGWTCVLDRADLEPIREIGP